VSYEFVAGRYPVLSVIANPRREPRKLFFQTDLDWPPVMQEIKDWAERRHVQFKEVSRITLEKRFSQSGQKHQGVVLITSPYPYAELDEVLPTAVTGKAANPLYLILDHIQDPHNLGALIRSAELAGVTAVIIPKDRACEVTTTVVKTSAGASELIPVCLVTNINRTIDVLKEHGICIIGVETGGATLYNLDLNQPLALIIGNENDGLKKLTMDKCDHLAEIPMHGRTASLNASVAGGIAMFEAARQRSL